MTPTSTSLAIQAEHLAIISDLHLLGASDPMIAPLNQWILQNSGEHRTLILAGDIFDLFVGNHKPYRDRFHAVFEALGQAVLAGTKVHLIEGNHDLLLKQAIHALTAEIPPLASSLLEVHSNFVIFELGATQFFVGHGDLVDPMDYAYRVARTFFRSPLFPLAAALTPTSFLDLLGARLSRYTRDPKYLSAPEKLELETRDYLRHATREFCRSQFENGCDYVILGHFHDAQEMTIKTHSGREGRYFNVGFPRIHKSFLHWDSETNKMTREPFPSGGIAAGH